MAGLAPVPDGSTAPVARSPAMRLALNRCDLYAPARTPVIFVGDTGTGKSHFARYLHSLGPRSRQPFVDVTAAELEGDVGRDHLFGHERGGFTGAYYGRTGLFQDAGAGTLLLDDLHLLSWSQQAQLLRVLDHGLHRRTGASRDLPIGCRVLVGMQGDPDRLLRDGTLLPDLRFRLGHCVIEFPPLRERPEDIPVMAMEFLRECPEETGVSGPGRFAPSTLSALEAASWPGNVRDLKATVIAAYLHAQHDEVVRPDHLPGVAPVPRYVPHGDRDANDRAIRWALSRAGGCIGDAARLLGVHRNTVSGYVARQALHSSPDSSVQSA